MIVFYKKLICFGEAKDVPGRILANFIFWCRSPYDLSLPVTGAIQFLGCELFLNDQLPSKLVNPFFFQINLVHLPANNGFI